MHARPAALAALAALVGLSLAAGAPAAVDVSSSLRFGFVPQRVFQGQPAAVSVVVRPTGVRCTAVVRYANAAAQTLPAVVARAGKASWKWKVPATAQPGAAAVNVACGRAGKASRGFTVVRPPSTPALAVVKKHGFSQRVRLSTRTVSYGVELANPSPENDALDVTVLVNFVDATGRVVDSDTSRVDAIGAASIYYLGGYTSIPDSSPVSKIEVITRLGGQSPKRKLGPSFMNVLVQPLKSDPAWVGSVTGTVENDYAGMLLQRTKVSTVVYDAGGNVIGGSTGSAEGGLLPGVRAYFQASSGANSIPFERAAAAGVSTLGTYIPTS